MPRKPLRLLASATAIFCLSLPTLPMAADSASGAYLAGRQAILSSDFEAAAKYFQRALGFDRNNPSLMQSAVLAELALGRIDDALPVARYMESEELNSQIANMVITASLIDAEDYAAVLEKDGEAQGVGPLVDGLLKGWAYIGMGSAADGLAQFDKVAEDESLRPFALYQKSLALASVGDFEGAEGVLGAQDGLWARTWRRAAIARAEVLSQLERNDEAVVFLEDTFSNGFDPAVADLVERLKANEELPFSHVTSVKDGMAEVFFSIGSALRGEASDDYALVYARVAAFLRPDHIDAQLLSADLLEQLRQYDLAVATYKQVPRSSPERYAAELGRAEALRRAAKPDAAIEVLEQLATEFPDQSAAWSALGDLQRQEEDYASAVGAYDKALSLSDPKAPSSWFLLYARGISHERLKQWPEAETDFRAALELNPDQPQVLNYLGYSLVEKHEKLDEALGMIERAVAARPDSGYIVDSLGWVLYRLGRYEEAVGHMETAVELMPVDPVVNDHLGDVYWAVGRAREAEFQWRRALSFIDPEDTDGEADPDRIRRKLEIGLDAVLVEEGADPLKVANDDG